MYSIIGQQARVEIRYKRFTGITRATTTHPLHPHATAFHLTNAVDEALKKLPEGVRIISYSVTVEQEA